MHQCPICGAELRRADDTDNILVVYCNVCFWQTKEMRSALSFNMATDRTPLPVPFACIGFFKTYKTGWALLSGTRSNKYERTTR